MILTGDEALAAEVLELRAEKDQLLRTLSTRAVIDRARGMVMVLGPCSSETALVGSAQDQPLPEQMHRELRRALKLRTAPGAVTSTRRCLRPSRPSDAPVE
ncbi:hypothetical protein [Streptomyces sp. NBC_01465]|uniref:hypothetical protein n=1 Tax=Streptomyces sp. NBC_01465 TaxID=2903878 RepID=UPI003FCD1780